MTELEKILEIRYNSQGSKDAKRLAELYVSDGKEAVTIELNKIIKLHKLKDFEVAMLTDKIKNILQSHGVIIKRTKDTK